MTAASGFKRLGFVLLIAVGAVGAILMAAGYLISAETVRQQTLREIRATTGLEPILRGPASVALFPNGRVSFDDVVLGDPQHPALTAERLTARLRFFPLLIGRVEIEDKPDILWDQPELERLYARLEDEYELHERLANPLYPIAFAILAIAFVGQARSIRQNSMRGLMLAFFLAVGFRLGGFAMNNIVTAKASAVPLLYALPASAILLSLVIIWRHRRQPQGRRGLLLRSIDTVIERLQSVARRSNRDALTGMRGGQSA